MAVFAKAPVPGTVKTRLAGVLGAEGAARLHARLIERALATARAAGVGPVELWCAPDERHEFFAACAARHGASLAAQRGPDLGARMAHAFERAFAQRAALVVIGADCPAIAPALIAEAARRLGQDDAVVAPAEDGGYVLVGLSRPVAGLFDGIAWGGAEVMRATRERLAAAGARWSELDTLWDVDRPEDYARLAREGLLAGVQP